MFIYIYIYIYIWLCMRGWCISVCVLCGLVLCMSVWTCVSVCRYVSGRDIVCVSVCVCQCVFGA